MKLILTMVVLAIAVSSGGCASRRAANAAAKAAKADKTAAAKTAAPAGSSAANPAAPVAYAVSAAPGSVAPSVSGARPAGTSATTISITPADVEKVPFQIGASSVTVERMAKTQGCNGGKGAGLVTEKGPVEVYRMQCDDGKVFLAKCELRQCSPLRW